MLEYGLYQPLRFHKDLKHQNRNRKGFTGDVFKLISPVNYLLPFQIKRDPSSLPFNSIKYVSVKSGAETDVLPALADGEVKTYSFNSYDVFLNFGSQEHTLSLTEGEYYLVVSDGAETWYSETVFLRNFDPDDLQSAVCELTKITYFDTCDVGGIFYRTAEYGGVGAKQYRNVFYLEVGVGKPEYEYNEEGEEDGLGNFSPDYKRLTKNYFLQAVLPEYMLDAVQLLPLHKNIEVHTSEGYTGSIDTITINSEWQGDKGVWALTDILFSTDFVVKTACCSAEEVPLPGCLRTDKTFVARLIEGSDDYNNFEYTKSGTPDKIPLIDGDRVMVLQPNGILRLKDYDEAGGTYDTPTLILSVGEMYADSNTLSGLGLNPTIYYLWGGSGTVGFLEDPQIDDLTYDTILQKWYLVGKTFDPSTVQIYGKVNGSYVFAAQDTGVNFNDNGTFFDIPPASTHIRINAVGASGCIARQSAEYELPFGGVGTGAIGSTFLVG